MRPGFVYAFWSDNCPYVKIGRTAASLAQRLAEVNASIAYRETGPWHLLACQKVTDHIVIETVLHTRSGRRMDVGTSASELFEISRAEALALLESIPTADLFEAVPIDKLRLEPEFMSFLGTLFATTGLEAFLDQQEAWTFSLFPSTSGGRYYTLNIGRHEVGYSALPVKAEAKWGLPLHSFVVDELVLRDQTFRAWLAERKGVIVRDPYRSGLNDAVSIIVELPFDQVCAMLRMESFRRALIAYWFDALLRMRERGTRSLFARFHNYSAVTAIMGHLREMRRFREKV